ncbi:uncharacterized protein LOC112574688 [Pomacea canaliculata]|uniref:uncharacterized protein LOC112574688 n=1 Tax=Pomacea canaliculata TaxID=400727 RepID=UPI000D726066|nr:uncharacterized protein LOC112574688 [Pomacea canaliculata]
MDVCKEMVNPMSRHFTMETSLCREYRQLYNLWTGEKVDALEACGINGERRPHPYLLSISYPPRFLHSHARSKDSSDNSDELVLRNHQGNASSHFHMFTKFMVTPVTASCIQIRAHSTRPRVYGYTLCDFRPVF